MAFVETAIGTGSASLVAGGYLVTNYHVLWPYDLARVVFPDGTEFIDVPLVAWDPLIDIAVLGPIETDISPVELSKSASIPVGSDVYLIGYPGEAESFPQPSLSRGLVSRLRSWEGAGITYIQTDATIAGGQSGGVLVSSDGEVVGVSGFVFTEGDFALVASSADVAPIVSELIAGDTSGLRDRLVPASGQRLDSALATADLEYTIELANPWDSRVYVVDGQVGKEIEVSLEGESNVGIFVIGPPGDIPVYADDARSGRESGSAAFSIDGPHFVFVAPGTDLWDPLGSFHVESNQPLIPFTDPDDGTEIAVGQRLLGNVDYPYDLDFFVLALAEGETVEIAVDSPNFDPFVQVDFPGSVSSQVLFDDDSGGGLFGLSSKLVHRAPTGSDYYIIVSDQGDVPAVGGYILTVESASPEAQFVTPETVEIVDSPHGPMTLHKNDHYGFSVQYPVNWQAEALDPALGIAGYYVGPQGAYVAIVEEDLIALGFGETTLEEYQGITMDVVSSLLPGFELISEMQTTTSQGFPAVLLEISGLGGSVLSKRLIHVNEDSVGFSVAYVALKERFEELELLIDYSLGTFRIDK